MTKVQKVFPLRQALDEEMLLRIADAHAVYGIERILVAPSRTELRVEYDASRLREAEVTSALQRAGIAITPQL